MLAKLTFDAVIDEKIDNLMRSGLRPTHIHVDWKTYDEIRKLCQSDNLVKMTPQGYNDFKYASAIGILDVIPTSIPNIDRFIRVGTDLTWVDEVAEQIFLGDEGE